MSQITNSYDFGPKTPQSLVVLLHGLGSNGQDLISLVPLMGSQLPDTLFLSPDAPFACDMAPPNYPNSYQWFSLAERDPHKILTGVQEAAPIIVSFIEEQAALYNVPAEKIVLGGFSQGCMMSLYVGTHYKKKLAGILGYSGALVWEPDTDVSALQKPPVCLIHGEADDVVPIEAYQNAAATLKQAGYNLSGHSSPGLPHSIDEDGLRAGVVFLKEVLFDVIPA